MSSKQAYQKEIEDRLDALDAQIGTIQPRANHAHTELKTKCQGQLRLLTERRETAQFRLGELKQSSEAAWETMKIGVENAFNKSQTAFNKAVIQFQ